MKTMVLIFALLSALMPVITQKSGLSEKYGFKIKMLCALMYFATGLLCAFALRCVTAYSLMLIGALFFGVLGDFFLSYRNDKYFVFGVVFFALGHIVYILTFLLTGEHKLLPHAMAVIAATAAVSAVLLIFAKARLSLGGRKKLLLIYAPVLAFAFVCAFAGGTLAVGGGNMLFGLCLIFGAILFFFSDLMIGIDKGGIKRPEFLHNAVSYTYFPAQVLFALSILFQ